MPGMPPPPGPPPGMPGGGLGQEGHFNTPPPGVGGMVQLWGPPQSYKHRNTAPSLLTNDPSQFYFWNESFSIH
eukprot:1216602-Rhodomonas_salina.1